MANENEIIGSASEFIKGKFMNYDQSTVCIYKYHSFTVCSYI